jgi:peptidoglycan/LPS O-acetylase OafA/YrhL
LDIGAYLSKRFWRIYIPFWLVLLLFIIFAYWGGAAERPGITNILLHALTLHDLSENYFYGINPSFWSLGTEIKLYLLYPVFLWLRQRYGINRSFVAICVLGLSMVGLGILFKGLGRSLVYQKSVLQLWFIWCAGAYYAEVFYNRQRLLFKRHKALLALLAYILIIIFNHRMILAPFAFFPATILMLLLFEHIISASFAGKWQLAMRLVALIGLCSYSLYLIHQPFLSRLLDVFGLTRAVRYAS